MKQVGSLVWAFGLLYTFGLAAHIDQEQEPKRLYTTKFSHVLLIINFNHPYYGNIDFIKRLYAPFFPNIVFYGEKADPRVTALPTHIGYYISDLLADVITKHPHFEGYLFLEDDCVLNMWNCFSLDLNKIWILPNFNRNVNTPDYHIDFFIANVITGHEGSKWGWGFAHSYEPAKNAYQTLLPQDVAILEHNIGYKNICSASADMFYFPGRLSKELLRLTSHFKNVYIEIMVPTMLACLDYKENWEKVTIIWGLHDSYLHVNWPHEYTCIHPLKLSSVANQALIKNVFEKMMPGLIL